MPKASFTYFKNDEHKKLNIIKNLQSTTTTGFSKIDSILTHVKRLLKKPGTTTN